MWCVFEEEVMFEVLVECVESDEFVCIWLVGCLIGEEVYFFGMSFYCVMNWMGVWYDIKIFGIDINQCVFDIVSNGFYFFDIEV